MTTEQQEIKISEFNRPLGYYTWVASMRDGTSIIECSDPAVQRLPIDVLDWDQVASLHLIPWQGDGRSYVRIDLQPGERVRKVFTRTLRFSLDGQELPEAPVIDTFTLVSESPANHYAFPDGSILITTADEPPT